MVDCAEGIKKIIRWRYEGENWQQIIGAGSYLIEQELYRCPVPYRFKWRHRSSPSHDWEYKEVNPEIYPPYSDFKFEFTDNHGRNLEGFPLLSAAPSNSKARRTQWFFSYWGFDKYNRPKQYRSPSRYGSNYFSAVATSEFLGGERTDGLPDNCGDCVLTILSKNGKVVLERTNNTCPEVKEYCEDNECHEGTCECRNGSIVCCHDSITGEVVKQFRKYKQ